ncbi:MAG: phosphatase PAP2 family protein [Chitinispirillaceae bacterium]|nr:phosphatase PAP2 family protein [Chitinispirillaceae bacterium]
MMAKDLFDFILLLDKKLFLFINVTLANPFFDILFTHITELNFWLIPIILLSTLFIIKKGKASLPVILVILITISISDPLSSRILKPLFSRHRPCHPQFFIEQARFLCGMKTSFSFPSSHAVNLFATAVVLSGFFKRYKWLFFSIALLISFSRIYVGVHYPLDIIGGIFFGFLIGIFVLLIYNNFISRKLNTLLGLNKKELNQNPEKASDINKKNI